MANGFLSDLGDAVANTEPHLIVGHVASTAGLMLAWGDVLPSIAAAPCFCWYAICVWESKTVQGIVSYLKSKWGKSSEPTA